MTQQGPATQPLTAPDVSVQTLTVYPAAHLRVESGVNLGDPLGCRDELQPEDVYRLSPTAALAALRIRIGPTPPFEIAPGSATGRPGAALHLDCCVTLMAGDGTTVECLVLVETDAGGHIAEVHAFPLAPMMPRTDYVLVGASQETAPTRFAQSACVSFTRGTLITMAGGAQTPVEALRPGDRVLTRDDGPQPLRWIGHQTVRAQGLFAPVLIREGTLNNARDLVVSPDHRLFVYQRRDALGAGRSELMVRARHLVNGDSIRQLSGGFVDYYQMLFDRHQIVFVEGIAAESTLLDARTHALLPDAGNPALAGLLPAHGRSAHPGLEVQEALLARPDTADRLRKSSIG